MRTHWPPVPTSSTASTARAKRGPVRFRRTDIAALDVPAILSLQRTVGNRAVQTLLARPTLQRHPEHAEEQEVQRSTRGTATVQRHPEHADEHEVQGSFVGTPTVQRVTGSTKIIAKEQALTQQYGIQIGPVGWPADSDEHLSLAMLERIENVLRLIPPEHLRGPSLTGGIKSGSGGAASTYDPDQRVIEIVVPPGVPNWLYPVLSKSWAFQRYVMDLGAKMGYTGLTTGDIVSPKRKVMGGGTGGSLRGNLLEWTVRHELGHGVDEQIKFTNQRAMQARFGGWKHHPDANRGASGDMEVATTLLANAGINYLDRQFQPYRVGPGRTLPEFVAQNAMLTSGAATDIAGVSPDFVRQIEAHDPGFMPKWSRFGALKKKAHSQPWSTADGGGADLERGGRLYFVDSYGKWVSCLADKRNSESLSRYMFSTPGEWFAEAYAAYYAPDDATRNQLTAPVREWFASELGVPTNMRSTSGAEEGDAPGLSTGGDDAVLAELQPALQDLADAVEGL